jgi:acyl carrier protein
MGTPTVKERIIKIVAKGFGVTEENITDNSHFDAKIEDDWPNVIETSITLEDEFGVNINEAKIKTVGELIDYINKELAKKNPPITT